MIGMVGRWDYNAYRIHLSRIMKKAGVKTTYRDIRYSDMLLKMLKSAGINRKSIGLINSIGYSALAYSSYFSL